MQWQARRLLNSPQAPWAARPRCTSCLPASQAHGRSNRGRIPGQPRSCRQTKLPAGYGPSPEPLLCSAAAPTCLTKGSMSDQNPSTAFSSESRPMLPCQSKLTTWAGGRGMQSGPHAQVKPNWGTHAGWGKQLPGRTSMPRPQSGNALRSTLMGASPPSRRRTCRMACSTAAERPSEISMQTEEHHCGVLVRMQ